MGRPWLGALGSLAPRSGLHGLPVFVLGASRLLRQGPGALFKLGSQRWCLNEMIWARSLRCAGLCLLGLLWKPGFPSLSR